MATIFDSPIGWAQWRLRNGWKAPLIASVAYAGLLILILTIASQSENQRNDAMSTWRSVILVVQACILTLLGGARISAAIRVDITQHLVESHRLMPMSPLAAVGGYLWGPNAAPAALFMVGLVGGAYATAAAKLNVASWLIANLVLLSYSLFCWVAIAFAASQSRASGLLVFIGLAILSFATGPFIFIAPAAVLLNGPMMSRSIYDYRYDPSAVMHLLVISSAAQLLIGSVLYVGVARKYRRPTEPALGITPALLGLILWLGASVYATTEYRALAGGFSREATQAGMLTAAIISSMLIAVVPIANTVRHPRAEKISPLIALACAAVIATTFCMLPLPATRFYPVVSSAAVVLVCFCVGLCMLLRTIRGWSMMTAVTIVWLLLLWLGPIVIDFVRYASSDATRSFHPTVISGFSPVGALANLLNDGEFDVMPGVVFQVLLCGGMILLYLITRKTRPSLATPA